MRRTCAGKQDLREKAARNRGAGDLCDSAGAGIELDYGAVEIGGERFVMPLRGVSISGFIFSAHHYLFDGTAYIGDQIDKFPITSIDDLEFSAYQRYKPRLRILPLKSLDKPAN